VAPRSIVAIPNPSLLIWARESLGLSHENIAKRLKVSQERIKCWETGEENPSISQLRKVAELYKRPLAVFYLPERPKDFQPLRDFRRTGVENRPVQMSPDLMLAIRKTQDRREWALELYDALGEDPPKFDGSISVAMDEEEAATELRRAIGIRFEAQTRWREDYEALRNWRLNIESAGVLTFQASDVETREARGFSLSNRPLSVVVANVKDAPRGRIFTYLHELVHVMLKESGVCDIADDRHPVSPTAKVETYCNRVAGASLFPKTEFLSDYSVRSHKKGDPRWTDNELRDLSHNFGGSREAALVRLLGLGLTTWDYYLQKREEFYDQYRKAKERSKPFAAPHNVAINSAGPTFTRLVLEGLNRNRITASDFADYLQIRVKHLPDVRREASQLVAGR
jgi:Zn-dependent peptidase ImmA (M78 family)/DNA-binding XRE family transcriptional regulator